MPQPCAEMAELRRPLLVGADPDADALDPVLVPVHPGHRLAPDLAEAIEPIRPELAIEPQRLVHRMHADGVVGTGEQDALHAMPPGALIDFVQRTQIILDDLGQRTLDAGAGQVDQHIDALEQPVHHRRVAQVAVADILALDQRLQRLGAAGRPQIDAALEQFRPQHAPDIAPGSG